MGRREGELLNVLGGEGGVIYMWGGSNQCVVALAG